MTPYARLLKDPRWQKKRLEIFERDGFACRVCGDKTKTLHVHHAVYFPGAKPWDYPNHLLLTMCEPHHTEEEAQKLNVSWEFVEAFRQTGAMNSDLRRMAQIVRELSKGGHQAGTLAMLQVMLDELWTTRFPRRKAG